MALLRPDQYDAEPATAGARAAAAEAAASAGLRYVADGEPGYRRRRRGNGFSYQRPDGETLRDPVERERIDALVIPPAWSDVWICLDADGHLQATGRDGAGRKQYLYHPRWTAVRDAAKFAALIRFGEALPALRRRLRHDLKREQLSRRKLTAAALRLLDQTLIRVGNKSYAKANGSYGLTTLRNKHVRVSGAAIALSFTGKSGEKHVLNLVDEELADIVRQCQDLPGYELFRYRDEDGALQTIDSRDVNDYLREATAQEVSAKDFRTWGGTVTAAQQLYALSGNGHARGNGAAVAGGTALACGPDASETARGRAVVEAIKAAAQTLNNTPAICRQSYVHPVVIESFLAGEFEPAYAEAVAKARAARPRELRLHEAATLRFLRSVG